MQLNEIFSRQAGVTVWTKMNGRLFVDRGQDGMGMSVAHLTNKLVTRNEDGKEENTRTA